MSDPLSNVLRAVRLVGGVFLDARFTAPWCVTANMDAGDCAPLLSEPTHLIALHVVVEGHLQLSIGGDRWIEVAAGELVWLPRNDSHLLASTPGVTPRRAGDLIEIAADGTVGRIHHGGGGTPTRVVCGFLGTSGGYNPLLATLPPVLKLDMREARSRSWIEATVRFAADELAAGRYDDPLLVSKLSEVLLIEAVRTYAQLAGAAAPGWLQGITDPHLGRALAALHASIDQPWTAEALAREAGLSRSVFVERFTATVGVPPIRYLTLWRLQTARDALRDTARSLAQLANDVGYESEEAFSRAFKRTFGVSPGHWRDGG